jgi:hypothetical protein
MGSYWGICVAGNARTAADERAIGYCPTASLARFVVKLVFAAPANFFSAAWLSRAAFESRSHFFIKLVSAAPWSFLASAFHHVRSLS